MVRGGWTHDRRVILLLVVAGGLLLGAPPGAVGQDAERQGPAEQGPAEPRPVEMSEPRWEFEIEAKAHFRDSDENRFPVNFPFLPEQLPPGRDQAFLETVNPGSHVEISVVTLRADYRFSEALSAHAKVDVIDLYDRNPTSTDDEVDVDELWLRFGRETEPAFLAAGTGAYFKVGKFPKFERQDDRHLESYGLVATAFNRLEDVGAELGIDLGRHVYLKLSATQGNPVFLRDPNALAGDNGTPELLSPLPNPDPELNTGIVIPYDADVEDVDFDGDLELGAGLGVRFANAGGSKGVDFLAWGYQRDLAETVDLEGTFYGGDLDLLRGPFNAFSFPITDDEKEEFGANLWLYLEGFSLFAQYVDQELAGLPRTGIEVEVAWRFDLPLRFTVAQRQLFTHIAPAVRFSRLEPDFASPPVTPSPSFSWDWDKIDAGLRLGIVRGVDLTLEYADNEFVLGSGAVGENDELLATLRWRL